jgi:hypothetical protein
MRIVIGGLKIGLCRATLAEGDLSLMPWTSSPLETCARDAGSVPSEPVIQFSRHRRDAEVGIDRSRMAYFTQ